VSETVLIVPGYHGSGAAHWQTWLQRSLPDAERVSGIDWESPVLPEWTAAIHRNIEASAGRVWIVAHSFGCLASAVVASESPEKVAGVLFVAPADPERFSAYGTRDHLVESGITHLLPQGPLGPVNSIVVASENDPWLQIDQARLWARRWDSKLVNIGQAGHINTESGYGPWPAILDLLAELKARSVPVSSALNQRTRPSARSVPDRQSVPVWHILNFTY